MDGERCEMGGVWELANPTEQILAEIQDEGVFTRRDVAMTYRLAMQSSAPTDWPTVNRAIVSRWSMAALVWIKEQAHSGRCFRPTP